MSLLNIITSQLIDVIEWTDDSRDTLSYRWPDEDKEIKNGAQLIVRESQLVQFVAAGQYADLFGPGKHTLSSTAERSASTATCRIPKVSHSSSDGSAPNGVTGASSGMSSMRRTYRAGRAGLQAVAAPKRSDMVVELA